MKLYTWKDIGIGDAKNGKRATSDDCEEHVQEKQTQRLHRQREGNKNNVME